MFPYANQLYGSGQMMMMVPCLVALPILPIQQQMTQLQQSTQFPQLTQLPQNVQNMGITSVFDHHVMQPRPSYQLPFPTPFSQSEHENFLPFPAPWAHGPAQPTISSQSQLPNTFPYRRDRSLNSRGEQQQRQERQSENRTRITNSLMDVLHNLGQTYEAAVTTNVIRESPIRAGQNQPSRSHRLQSHQAHQSHHEHGGHPAGFNGEWRHIAIPLTLDELGNLTPLFGTNGISSWENDRGRGPQLSPQQIDAIETFSHNNNSQQVADVIDCSICQAEILSGSLVKRLECNHTFHASCISAWLLQSATCPTCRSQVNPLQTNESGTGNESESGTGTECANGEIPEPPLSP